MNTTEKQRAAGDLDPTFGDAGIVNLTFFDGTTILAAAGLTPTPEGKVYVAGYAQGFRYALARLDQTGKPDETFGKHGVVTGTFDTYNSWGSAVQIMPDGRLVLIGQVEINNVDYRALACFDPDGVLDTSFGTDGWVILMPPFASVNWTGSDHQTSSGMTSRPGGKYPAAITRTFSSGRILVSAYVDGQTAIVSLRNDGALDTSFGGTGYAIVERGAPNIWLGAIYDQSSKLVACGGRTTNDGAISHPYLVRLNADGSVDKNFGANGSVTFESETAQFSELAFTNNGNMVGVGYTLGTVTDSAMLLGCDKSGGPDASFNNGEPVFTSVEGTICAWTSGAFTTAAQQIVVAGGTFGARSTTLAGRFKLDGTPDLSFGNAGLIVLDLGVHTLSGAVLLLPDENILVGGQVLDSPSTFGYVARFLG